MKRKRIIIAAGGTGGHVFPATVIADELSARGFDVVFATDKRGLKYLGKYAESAIVQGISTNSRWKLYISLLYNILISVFRLIKIKPSMIIGFGGYPSVPFVFAGQVLRFKTIIHEQNAVIGKANQLLSKMASRILTSFPKTNGLPKSKKVRHIGNPSRFENLETTVNCHAPNKILIFGGSQGSRIFADIVQKAVIELSKSKEVEVVHQCREEDMKKVQVAYSAAGIKAVVKTFFGDMEKRYQDADVVISRSGASSIFEIIHFAKPAILIPFANSINGDQLENARFLNEHNAALVIEEKDLNLEKLLSKLQRLFGDHDFYQETSKNLRALEIKNTTKMFADIVEEAI